MKDFLIHGRKFLMLSSDILAGVLAIYLTIIVRYPINEFDIFFTQNLKPFIAVLCVFIFSFYIFNLYSSRFNRQIAELASSFIKSVIVAFGISIAMFYIFGPFFKLAPKTNLLIFTGFFFIIDFYFRIIFKRLYAKHKINRKIFLINKTHNNLADEIKANQSIGYEIIKESTDFNYEEVLASRPDIVIVESIADNTFEKLYTLLQHDIAIYTLSMFYEETFQKIPTEALNKNDVIEYVNKNKSFFLIVKRFIDVAGSISLIIILSPLWVLTGLLVKATSRGPILYKQTRVALNDTLFTIYKFRSMRTDAEKDGPVWTPDEKNDARITPFGKFMRKTHLDEIPQLINILRGDISFVGPRPERPEFTKMLNKEVAYYDLRHSVKPGITGWAQINYRYASSVEDSREKLKYDFYYIKNRNIFLDILIIAKTIALMMQKR